MMSPTAPQRLDGALLTRLEAELPPGALLHTPGDCWAYGMDNSRRHHCPQAVALVNAPEQVTALLRLCHEARLPVTARGRGTGTAGGSVPLDGGLVISFERMNRVLELIPEDRLIVVEPGLTNQGVQNAIAAEGFFWPPDPTSSAICTVGGNIACNAAGPRAVKYGSTRDNLLGLRAVDGTGRPFRTGVRTTKGVVGYDLTRLIAGSEGTLALVTEATLRLTPRPDTVRSLRALYTDMNQAAHAVARLMAQPNTPCALEFIDGAALRLIREHQGALIDPNAGAMLMIEVDGPDACIDRALDAVHAAARGEGLLDLSVATTAGEVEALWAARKALSPTLRHVAPKKINEDVVVPVSRMPALIDGLERLAGTHRIAIVSFGHAGNGNIHVNLLVNPDDPLEMTRAHRCLDEVFDLVLRLGGTLSGEHGIGSEKRDFVGRELDDVSLQLMHAIKTRFDPHGILNPRKKLPYTDSPLPAPTPPMD